jgi:hypothetical protein
MVAHLNHHTWISSFWHIDNFGLIGRIGLCVFCPIICNSPGLAMLVTPSVDMVRRNTCTRIDPYFEIVPEIAACVMPAKSQEPSNTATHKEFIGGDLPPGRPSVITRVLGFDSRRFRVWQARRSRCHQIAQAPGALLLVSCCRWMSAA